MTTRTDTILGFKAPTVCRIVGISYRQLDYWARTGLAVPSIAQAAGSGTSRRYSRADLVKMRIVIRLLEAGMSLQRIRQAIALIDAETDFVDDRCIVSDGRSVFLIDSPSDLVGILDLARGIFAIGLGAVAVELEADVLADCRDVHR